MKPAWSSQFDADALPRIARRALPQTRDAAWGGATGAGVKVAIIDSGVDADHPAVGGLAGAVAIEREPDAPQQLRLDDGPHDDLVGHGTACAAIIRAVAPDAELYSVRVLGPTLRGQGAVFLRGIRWALDAGMDVVNLSLSTPKREYLAELHDLVDEAAFRSVMLVSAIANAPGASYPSQFAGVFSVAAHARHDPFGFDHNPAPPVEFGAPGIDVRVAWRGGGTVRATGNSFAAPHIAGLIARILSKHPGLTPYEMKAVLRRLADNAV